MDVKKILITGSEGYIGSVLTAQLLKQNYKLTGLDTLFFQKSHAHSHIPNYHLIRNDIRSVDKSAFKDCDIVIHLAALSNDPLGEINPRLTDKINFQTSVKLAVLAKSAGVKRFLFASSCSIYGKADKRIVNEYSTVSPLTAYASSKYAAEKQILNLKSQKFCPTILRFATVYGYSPQFRNDLVVNNLLTCALCSNIINVQSDGTPYRPLIDLRDVSNIISKFITIDTSKINGEIFNIGFDENNFRVKHIANLIKHYLPTSQVSFGQKNDDARSYRVSFAKLKKLIPKLQQKFTLTDSIKDMVSKLTDIKFSIKDFQDGNFSRIDVLKKLIKTKKLNHSLFWN